MRKQQFSTAGLALTMIGIFTGCGTTNVTLSTQGTTTTSSINVANQTSQSVPKKAKNKSTPSANTISSVESQKSSSAGQFVFTKPPHMWNGTQGWTTASVLALNNGSKMFGIRLLTTHDGGNTWSNAGPKLKSLNGLQDEDGSFYSPSLGWFVELAPDHEFIIQRTTDGGALWKSSTPIPTHLGDGGMQIDRVSQDVGYAVVRDAGMTNPSSELYQTVDGGASWKPLRNLPISGTIDFVSKENGWLAGTNNTPDPLLKANTGHTGMGYTWLYQTTDGGQSWKHIELPIPKSLTSDHTSVSYPIFRGTWGIVTVTFSPAKGDNRAEALYVTNDGGKSWTSYKIPTGTVADVQFLSPSSGFLKSYVPGKTPSSPETPEWFCTQNGGRTWTRLNISLPNQGTTDTSIEFSTNTNWWAENQTGLFKTTNGGKSWVQVP
ncbi:hypothetical protein LLE49_21920 [Alicyclobacillus tolerans]|uniref:WD40/YVTN/BNR-like repeat-containing protein n=1 Tax=Alicyclobacillus tolerans TaxID=90970 RepID=UPI001F222DF1|nr:hypothetical protein [Alicyclobacillus tolerans]MCF8567383.1 hypothetical protein [Alicyclobacillus tolerans]